MGLGSVGESAGGQPLAILDRQVNRELEFVCPRMLDMLDHLAEPDQLESLKLPEAGVSNCGATARTRIRPGPDG